MSTTEYEKTPRKYWCSVCGAPAPNKWTICAAHVNLTPAQREKERLRLRSNRPRPVEPPREFPQPPAQKLCTCGKPIRNGGAFAEFVTQCVDCAQNTDRVVTGPVPHPFTIPKRDPDRADAMYTERRK